MKITMYELLGLVKDGKAPKRIKSEGHYYNYNELEKDYYEGMGYDYEYLLANTSVEGLDDEIEIIEDTPKEEKKIPEIPNKLCLGNYYATTVILTINEIIDYLDYLKSKGDE